MASRPVVVGMGEFLWDLLPAGRQMGGAPANFAWHAAQLGAEGIVVSAVGADEAGRALTDGLRAKGLSPEFVSVREGRPTGAVEISFEGGQPRYVIREGAAWDFLEAGERELALARRADAVSVGTLAQRAPASREAIGRFLDATRPACLRLFDLNLRQHYYDGETVRETLSRCQVLKLNDEEWPWLARLLGVAEEIEAGLPALRERQGLLLAAVTRGGAGSLLCTAEGLSRRASPAVAVADTVGAGDSFAAALAVGLAQGRGLEEIHRQASEVAAFVCTRAGGTPPLPERLRQWAA